MSNIKEIVFADLTHTGVTVDANYFPLGCGFVAAYALKELGDQISVKIFKYPEDLSTHLNHYNPRIVAFSNYSWSFNLCYAFAHRIKKKYPNTVVVFGGPNYPGEPENQTDFMLTHTAIDFHIEGEGEIAFVELYKVLEAHDFLLKKIRDKSQKIPSTHYLAGDVLIHGLNLPRITDINIIPSPYLIGLMDKFFDTVLIPMLQTSRGCPYTCAYCHDGISYMNKLCRFSQQRINDEIMYVFYRHKVANLALSDTNFGIYEEDMETVRLVAALRNHHDWPTFIDVATAKQNKNRMINMAGMLKGGLFLGASVQSTDSEVLKNINRRNLPLEQMIELAQLPMLNGGTSFSEVILCLPGDTKDKHVRSVLDMLDIGIEEVRMYQFILLPGTLAASEQYRNKYGYKTRFRILPRCFGSYSLYREDFDIFEYHEVCVENNTMPYDDYKYCRDFDLTVEVFNNGGIMNELFVFLNRYGISRSNFILTVANNLVDCPELFDLYEKFRADEQRNFWMSKEELETFIATPEAINLYRKGVFGINQIFQYRTLSLLEHFSVVADLSFAVASNLLRETGKMSQEIEAYLTELKIYILSKKGNLLGLSDQMARRFTFDFVYLAKEDFHSDPFDVAVPDGILISFVYTDDQRRNIESYYDQYGRSLQGLTNYIQRGGSLSALYRSTIYA